MPVTLRVYDSAGNFYAEQTTGPGCTVKPSISVPMGSYAVQVTGASAGAYALAMGAKATQHPVLGVDIEYAAFSPGDPIEFLLDDPHEWVEAYNNSDYKVRAFHLDGPAVHVLVLDEAGVKIAEGIQRALVTEHDVAGEDVALPAESSDRRFILQLDRLVQEGSEVPSSIPTSVKLTLESGSL
jgi:hypothetical protein